MFPALATINTAGALGTQWALSYTVVDNYGNRANATRYVVLEDHLAPVLTLVAYGGSGPGSGSSSGAVNATLTLGAQYVEFSAMAWDGYYGNVTDTVQVLHIMSVDENGTLFEVPAVNTSVLGVYFVTYQANDPSNNIGYATRTISVVLPRASSSSSSGSSGSNNMGAILGGAVGGGVVLLALLALLVLVVLKRRKGGAGASDNSKAMTHFLNPIYDVDGRVASDMWYHGLITEEEGNNRVNLYSEQEGTFLLRDFDNSGCRFMIHVKYRGRALQYMLEQRGPAAFFLEGAQLKHCHGQFLADAVKHLGANKESLPCTLSNPVPAPDGDGVEFVNSPLYVSTRGIRAGGKFRRVTSDTPGPIFIRDTNDCYVEFDRTLYGEPPSDVPLYAWVSGGENHNNGNNNLNSSRGNGNSNGDSDYQELSFVPEDAQLYSCVTGFDGVLKYVPVDRSAAADPDTCFVKSTATGEYAKLSGFIFEQSNYGTRALPQQPHIYHDTRNVRINPIYSDTDAGGQSFYTVPMNDGTGYFDVHGVREEIDGPLYSRSNKPSLRKQGGGSGAGKEDGDQYMDVNVSMDEDSGPTYARPNKQNQQQVFSVPTEDGHYMELGQNGGYMDVQPFPAPPGPSVRTVSFSVPTDDGHYLDVRAQPDMYDTVDRGDSNYNYYNNNNNNNKSDGHYFDVAPTANNGSTGHYFDVAPGRTRVLDFDHGMPDASTDEGFGFGDQVYSVPMDMEYAGPAESSTEGAGLDEGHQQQQQKQQKQLKQLSEITRELEAVYHGQIDRSETERRLRRAGMVEGMYLLRAKDAASSIYVLSLVTGKSKVVHHLLHRDPRLGQYVIDSSTTAVGSELQQAVSECLRASVAKGTVANPQGVAPPDESC